MKRIIAIAVCLVAAAAWWAVSTTAPPPASSSNCTEPAAYPADFRMRLSKVRRVHLQSGAPLPDSLQWQRADVHAPIGSPEAKKGGSVRLSNAGPFPAHFLRFGGGAPQFFHQNLQAATEIPLLTKHPATGEISAGVAVAWARNGSTIYFRLHPKARYNNERPVRANDYLLSALLQAEQHCTEFDELAAAITEMRSHGDSVLSVTLRENCDLPAVCALLHAAEPAFYSEFDSRFRERYTQRIPPGTGPYRVDKLERGRMIELQRVQNWWGEALPLYRHRFNADTLEYHFLTSEAQVWEFLLKGKLDALQTRNITAWQERVTNNDELLTQVYDAEYPLPPYGIACNTRTLPDIHLRRGLMQAMDMDGALAIMMRGEGQRLTTFSSGYGKLTPTITPQYKYDAIAARACFAKAGFTDCGSDGILRMPDGTRLSVKLLYTPHEKISNMVNFLVQSAAVCGAEIVPEPVPWQSCQRQLQERSHQLVFWAVPAPQQPAPKIFFGADAAPEYSPFGLQDERMANLLEQMQTAPEHTLEQIDRRVYELAIWLPGWKENRVYLAHHKRLCIPPSPWCFDALDAHLFWVETKP